MTDETAQNDIKADSQPKDSGTPADKADKLFDAGGQDKKADSKGKESVKATDNKDQKKDTDKSSDATDEADKSDKDKKGEESKEGDESKETPSYDDVVIEGLPEGVEVDQELFGKAKEIFAEGKIPKEAAQKLMNLYVDALNKSDKAISDYWEQTDKKWKEAARTDKEIGGDNFDENVEFGKKAVAKFGTPALKEFFEQTRTGNHVEVIRFFARVGRAISEDGAFQKGTGETKRTAADVLFDNTKT